MSEPLIVYVCECERLPTADQDGAPWEPQEVGEPCSLCLATVRAVNITELEADRARLQAENERLRALEVRECENGHVDEFVGWVHIERMDERSLCLTAYGGVVYDLIAEKDGSLTIYCVDKGRVASKEQES